MHQCFIILTFTPYMVSNNSVKTANSKWINQKTYQCKDYPDDSVTLSKKNALFVKIDMHILQSCKICCINNIFAWGNFIQGCNAEWKNLYIYSRANFGTCILASTDWMYLRSIILHNTYKSCVSQQNKDNLFRLSFCKGIMYNTSKLHEWTQRSYDLS